MIFKIAFSSIISLSVFANEAPREPQKFANGSSFLNVVTLVKPVQAIILGYLDYHNHAHITDTEKLYGVAYCPYGQHMATVSYNDVMSEDSGPEITIRNAHTFETIRKFDTGFRDPYCGGIQTILKPKNFRYVEPAYLSCKFDGVKKWDASNDYAIISDYSDATNIDGVSVTMQSSREADLKTMYNGIKTLPIYYGNVALSKDFLVLRSVDGLQIYDPKGGNLLFKIDSQIFNSVAISPDEQYVAGTRPGCAEIINLKDRMVIASLELPEDKELDFFYSLALITFSSDSKNVIYPSGNRLLIFNIPSNKWQAIPVQTDYAIQTCAYSPDNRYLTAVAGNEIHVLDNQAEAMCKQEVIEAIEKKTDELVSATKEIKLEADAQQQQHVEQQPDLEKNGGKQATAKPTDCCVIL